MAASSNQTDWQSLALLRFFLAWVVLCGHLHVFTGYASPWVGAFHAFGGKAAVVGFLLVSGYSIAASLERGSVGFYPRRFLRIYPLYFCAVALAGLVQLTAGDLTRVKLPDIVSGGRDVLTYVGNLLLLQTFVVKPIAFDGPLWSLAIEVFYYALAPLFVRMRPRWLLALVAFSLLCAALPRRDDLGLPYFVLTKLNALRYLWCWLLGFLLRRAPSAALAPLSLAGAALVFFGDDTVEPLSVVTYLVSLAVLVVATRTRLPRSLHALADYLGDVSYPLYLMHFPAFLFVLLHGGARAPMPMLAAALLVTLASLHAVDRYLKPRFVAPWVLGLGSASAKPNSRPK